jgi:HPt (histidine-containing phosphotransfer) domain-containing protein
MNDSLERIPQRFSSALDRLDGNVELLREMAQITAEDLPEVCAEVESAISQGDCDSATQGIHKLKGMLSTFESDGVTLEIQELLDLSRKRRAGELESQFDSKRDAIAELCDQIAEFGR